jgi:tetratricopeptide (TPR) repeat protein
MAAMDEAASILAEALSQIPDVALFPNPWNQRRHRLHAQIARNDELFRRVVALRKDDVQLWLERHRSASGLPWDNTNDLQTHFRREVAELALAEALRLAPKEPRLLVESAVFYAHNNMRDWERAADYLDRALALVPAAPPWRLEHNWVRGAASGSHDEVFERLAKKRPGDAWLRANRAWNQAQNKKVVVADRLMADAHRIKPNDRELLLYRARYHAGLRRWSLVAEDMEAARKLRDFGNDSAVWAETALYLAAARREDAHCELCKQMTERFGNSKEPLDLLRLAYVCLLADKGMGEASRLAEMAETALKAQVNLPDAVVAAALARRRLGKAEEAVSLIREHRRAINPAQIVKSVEIRLRLTLALALGDLHRDDEARTELSAAAKTFVGAVSGHPTELALLPDGQVWAAVEILGRLAGPAYAALVKEAHAARPVDLNAAVQRARNEGMHRRWQAAADEMLAVWRGGDFGKDSFTWLEAASYLAAASKVKEHREVCARMREQFKDAADPPTKQRIAFACLLVPEVGPSKEMVQLAEAAYKADPKPTWNVYPLALALRRAGRPKEAEQLIQNYLKSRAPMPDGWVDSVTFSLVLGFALADQKRPEEARAAVERALKVLDQPDTPTVNRLWQPPHAWAAAEALAQRVRPLQKDLAPSPRK